MRDFFVLKRFIWIFRSFFAFKFQSKYSRQLKFYLCETWFLCCTFSFDTIATQLGLLLTLVARCRTNRRDTKIMLHVNTSLRMLLCFKHGRNGLKSVLIIPSAIFFFHFKKWSLAYFNAIAEHCTCLSRWWFIHISMKCS
jgi:hypothetical protein